MVEKQLHYERAYRALRRVRVIVRYVSESLASTIVAISRNITPLYHFAILTLIGVFLFLVTYETLRKPTVVIEPIPTPQELHELGYTPRVVADRISDGSKKYTVSAPSSMEGMPIDYSLLDVDIVLASVGVSIKSVSAYLRELVGLDHTAVSGEILFDRRQEHVSLRLRLDRKEILYQQCEFSEACMDKLFLQGGYEITKNIKPFLLASYHYDQDEKDKVKEIIGFIYANHFGTEDYVRAVNLEGIMRLDENQIDKAISLFERVIRLDPNSSFAYNNWGIALKNQDNPDWDGAIEKYKRAIEIDPDRAFAYINWGAALARQENPDWDGAIEKYRRAIEIDSEHASAYINWGIALTRQESPDWDGAIEKYRRAIKIENHADAYYNWGLALQDQKDPDWDGVIKKYKRAIEIEPKHAFAYIYWGAALTRQENPDWDGAIEKYRRAIEIDSEHASAYINWGIALTRQESPDWDGAIEKYRRAIKIENHADAYYSWGIALAYQESPDWDGEIEKYKKAIKINPNHVLAYHNWGVALAYQESPDWDGAIEKFKKAIKIDPDRVLSYDYLGKALSSQGKCDEAAEIYEKARRIDGKRRQLKCTTID